MSVNDSTPNSEIPYGYCHCGCGRKTPLATETYKKFGRFKGQPTQFVKGHYVKSREKQLERFWSKVDKSGGDDACWIWTGRVDRNGYGHPWFMGKPQYAHRIAYMLSNERDPAELDVLHSCDNPACCNPLHLSLGTQTDNNADRDAKGRQARGERCGHLKLTDVQVASMRALWETGTYTKKRLSLLFGVSDTHVGHIIAKKLR